VNVLLAIAAAALGVALLVLVVSQRKMAARLLAASGRIDQEVEPASPGLSEAVSVVERRFERFLQRDSDTSAAESRLSMAMEAIPQGLVLFDPAGQIVFRNAAAATYLRARHEEALVEEVITALAREVTEGRSAAPMRTMELFGPPKRTLEVRAMALERGADSSALVMIEDASARKRLEAIRRDFVANISHELKTPVGALGLLAETLVAEEDPEVATRLAERMQQEAFRVARTIDDLLELSRLESEDVARSERVAIGAALREAVDRVSGAADARQIVIDLTEAAADVVVHGDRRQLVSATYNLLDNAVKYSDAGSTVEVGTKVKGRWVDIHVRDHGPGIPRRDLERVFERFYRVDRARSRQTGGTGLGLAIVRHVANNHEGYVRVESREGQGSTFTLQLPLPRASDGPAGPGT